MDRSQPITYGPFLGVDYSKPSTELAHGYTDYCLNVYGHGEAVRKRPRLKRFVSAGNASLGSRILGMVAYRQSGGQDNIVGIVDTSAGGAAAVSAKSFYMTILEPGPLTFPGVLLGSAFAVGFETQMEMTDDLAWWTGTNSVVPRKISGATPTDGTPGAAPTSRYRQATWHKRTLWHFSRIAPSWYTMEFSDIDDPETYPAANIERINPKGILHQVRCGVSMGEYMYVGTNSGVYLLSGATAQDFELRELPHEFGLVGKQSSVRVGGTCIAFTCNHRASQNSKPNDSGYALENVVAMSGTGQPVMLGNRIRPKLDALQAQFLQTSYGAIEQSRMSYWKEKQLVIMIPAAQQYPFITEANAQTTAYAMSVRDGVGMSPIWPWQTPPNYSSGALQTCSLLGAYGNLFWGGSDGYIYRFEDGGAMDNDAATYEAKWSTPYIGMEGGMHDPESVDLAVSQISGGAWTLNIFSNYSDAAPKFTQTFLVPLSASLAPTNVHIATKGAVSGAAVYRVEVVWADDSVRGEIQHFVINTKASAQARGR